MKSYILLFFIILTSLTSCNGQNTSQVKSETENESIIDITKVETVKELGKNIMLVYQDKKNNYWFGSWQDGLYKFDGKTILHFTTENGLPNNRIDEIKEDNFGNIFFNTSRGIVKSDGHKFHLLNESDLDNHWKLKPNDMWFKDGWNSSYVFRYDGKYLYKLPLPKTKLGEDHILKNPNNPNPYTVYCIYKDSKGNVWFGTGALGVFRYNGKSFDWILEKDVVEIFNDPSQGSNGVRSIIEDKDGYFWFNSMFRYYVYGNKKTIKNNLDSTFYFRENNIGSLDGKRDGKLNEYLSIAKDNNNELWIATYNDGVFHFDGKDITHFKVKDNSKEINLFTIYKDNLGNLWLGTPETGAYKFDGQAFERFKL
ncbi:MAG: two-component regulator propeller domain-containing protein [Aquaticitalea sp.]